MAPGLNIALLSIHSCPLGQLGTRDTGGMNVYVRELSRELGKMGHHVDIYTRAHDARDSEVDFPSPNVRVIHIQAGPVEDMGKMAQFSHLPNFILNMEAFSQRDGAKYDLVHSHYWLSGSVGMRFASQWKVPHAVMFHTLGAVKNRFPVGDAESALRLEAERELADKSRLIISATETEKSELIRLYQAPEERIKIVPCGVNSNLFRPLDRIEARTALGLGEGKIILFVGRIEALKGIDNLVRAMGLLKVPGDVRLLVIGGDGHSRTEIERLKDLTIETGSSRSIEFIGTVEQTKLPLYYSAADVSVVASYYESFCLVILESLACGTPVVSSPVGVAPEVIRQGENGFLTADNTPESLAAGLDAVLGARELNKNTVRQTAERFDWESIARQVESQYLELLKTPVADPEEPRL